MEEGTNRLHASSASQDVSLKDVILKINQWWQFLLSKWIFVSIWGVLGAIGGFLYSHLNKPVYVATTTFVLGDESSSVGVGGLSSLASIAGIDVGGSGGIFQGDNILELYTSRNMIVRTLLTKESQPHGKLLLHRYISVNNLKKKWTDKQFKLNFPVDSVKEGRFLRPNRLRDSVLNEIVRDIRKNYLIVSKPDKKLSTIQVEVKSHDEFFAKAFNDHLVANVNQFYIDTKTKKALQNVTILQRKTDSVRVVMNGSIYSSAVVGDSTPNLNPTRQVQRIAPMQSSQFAAETNKAMLTEMIKNLEVAKMALLKETPLIQIIDEPVFPLAVRQVGKFKACIFGSLLFGSLAAAYILFRRILEEIIN